MQYTKLGKTDIEISKLCVGCMSFGKAGAYPYLQTDGHFAHALQPAGRWPSDPPDMRGRYSACPDRPGGKGKIRPDGAGRYPHRGAGA